MRFLRNRREIVGTPPPSQMCIRDRFHKEPTYLFDILTDVNRAARMISERLACEQEPETPGAIPAEAA